jgi:uncharacterized protein (TIGR03437 family)
MKRAIQLAAMSILATAGGAWAQVQSTTKVGLSIEGVNFSVDGRQYNSTQAFLWPEGSKHIIQFQYSVDVSTGQALNYQYGNYGTVRYSFSTWVTNGPQLVPSSDPVIVITASPTLTSIIGQLTIEYKLRIQMANNSLSASPGCSSSGAPGDAPSDKMRSGIVYLDTVCIADTAEMFVTAGAHNLTAWPYPGFVFTGWFMNMNGQVLNAASTTVQINGDQQIMPQFMPAKRVRFSTNPPGLRLLIDRTEIQTPPRITDQLPPGNYDTSCTPDWSRLGSAPPAGLTPLCIGDFDFLPGSKHTIAAQPTQKDDAGKWWVFAGFSNGMGNNSTYTTDLNPGAVDNIVANFVPGYPVTLLTVPAGLKLVVDGTDTWLSYNFIWAAGEKHTVTAAATQSAKGRKLQFNAWSNSGPRTQEVSVPADPYGLTLTARYDLLGQVQLQSTPMGIKLAVDGEECTTPCVFDRLSGSQMQVTAPKSVPSTQTARYDFDNWGSESSLGMTVTFNNDIQVLRANFHASYLMTAASDPAGQVAFKYSPDSADGFFAEGTQVSVTATAKAGYKFRRWGGDLSGTYSTGFLTMDAPRSIVAMLDKVPYIAPAGVKNAAGDTPDGAVAPGSIISIYGEHLAQDLVVGPVNPLAQTLGNVTVTVNDRILPLLFVSPQQINAQVPSGLTDGTYPIRVSSPGQPDVVGSFTVRRNAPGLFSLLNEQGGSFALALHEDGTPVTPDSPARRREVVSIYGTGFGPFDHTVIDGFLVPDPTMYKLIDPVAVQAGDLTFSPEWTGPASTAVGATVMKLRIADEMPQASTLDLTVTINGAQSNKVQLPVE